MSSNVSNRGPRPGVLRGKYNKIDIAIKERLIQAFENGSDWKEAAETLNIKESTARSIILRQCEEDSVADRRGGRRDEAVKLTAEVIERMVAMVEAKPDITLKAIQEELAASRTPVFISITTISRGLEGRLITMKKLHVNIPFV